MGRLTAYTFRQIAISVLALIGIAVFLAFLVQAVQLFGLVTERGQNLFTLLGQVALTIPGLVGTVLTACLGVGLARALRALQDSRELSVMHVQGLLSPLLGGIGSVTLCGVALALALNHLVSPLCDRAVVDWSASIAAELVSHSIVPHRFTELADKVTVVIGDRDDSGNITDFFADDSRDSERQQTYFARKAIMTRDDEGYVLRLIDGAMQYLTAAGQFSEVAFGQYDLPLDTIADTEERKNPISQLTSIDLLNGAGGDANVGSILLARSLDALRALAIALLVTSLAAFPSGARRNPLLPLELIIVLVVMIERGVSIAANVNLLGVTIGIPVIALIAVIVLGWRLRVFRPVRRRVVA